jgi:mercuric ion transport protein
MTRVLRAIVGRQSADRAFGIGIEMESGKLLKIGIVGTVVTAICCFTPLLVILLGAIGFSAIIGALDYVLLPALVVFLAVAFYAFWKKRQS